MNKIPVTDILRLLLVDETFERAALLESALLEAGYHIAAHVECGADLPGLVSQLLPDLIILDTESPSRDMLNHLSVISRDYPCPIVIFTNDDDGEKIRAAIRAGVSAYVVNGLQGKRLRPIIEAAKARFSEFHEMRNDLERVENQLRGRKDVERAKGILMKQRGWSEDEAYQALRKMAMDKGMKLSELARQMVTMAGLLI